jgi:hypothetical protein
VTDFHSNDSKSNRSKRRRERNEAAIREAAHLLKSKSVSFDTPDAYTLQFNLRYHFYSYWPGTQTLFRDGDDQSIPKQGLDEISQLVDRSKRPPIAQSNRTHPHKAERPPEAKTIIFDFQSAFVDKSEPEQ